MQSVTIRPPQAKAPTFEFTKRKRWADLLVTELTESVILILSADCHILYCGAAVNEILGWRDDELIDGDLADLINLDDRANFQAEFLESVRSRDNLLSYARLRCKAEFEGHQPIALKEVLFEIQGYPHYIANDNECKCFFAMARPYPSRNTAVLNTFLELKMDNEVLQQRAAKLRAQNGMTGSSVAGPSNALHSYNTTPSTSSGGQMSIRTSIPNHMMAATSSAHLDYSMSPLYPSTSSRSDEIAPSPTTRNFDTISGYGDRDEETSAEPMRKKQKKSFCTEQHVCVTCGRTDSPEWRKGPNGPKTLCNACGLRWAKKMRKFDDVPDGGGAGSSTGMVQGPNQNQFA